MAPTGQIGKVRLGADIGGTFTDIVLEKGDRRLTHKELTNHTAPEIPILNGIDKVLTRSGLGFAELDLVVHGTTLATNALIERRGAKTALITTDGFRDTLEMGTEARYEAYDLSIELPPPLVPRDLRFTVRERLDFRGSVLVPLKEDDLGPIVGALRDREIEAVAITFLHSYRNDAHERRAAEILSDHLEDVAISISSEVSPEQREYQRMSTTCANAYVQPTVDRYLRRLEHRLRERGFGGSLLVMLSGGGLTTVETAARYPVRLVESGPAGGALFAAHVASELDLDRVLAFDMGGTTAKLTFIEDAQPHTSRQFETARVYRFRKGSGLPLSVPVVQMIEIGAGGGSISQVSKLDTVQVGPRSAGSEPGPVCYGRGGMEPTVTDADVVLGRIDSTGFSGDSLQFDADSARSSIDGRIGQRLALSSDEAAIGICEVVDENMAAAARMHAIESGIDLRERTLIAFGGAGPLHAGSLVEKLGIGRFIVPAAAGVGSAVGFLRAPISYEIVRSNYQCHSSFDRAEVNELLGTMAEEARSVVTRALPGASLIEKFSVFMRFVGQGCEIEVPLPGRSLGRADVNELTARFVELYRELLSWTIVDGECEFLSWKCSTSEEVSAPALQAAAPPTCAPDSHGRRRAYVERKGGFREVPVLLREELPPGARISGPAIIQERDTTTVLPTSFVATVTAKGYLDCVRDGGAEA